MPPSVGSRIVVYGWTGSGKTTVARRLGTALGLPVIELDALFWLPRWQPRSDDEFRNLALASLAACPDGWVCDGNYGRIRDGILPHADTVVLLRLPFRVTYWRLIRRTLTRARKGNLLWGTNRESFRSRTALLVSALSERVRRISALFDGQAPQASVIVLTSSRGVEAFLAELDAR